jgi:hypothetical protein
MSISSAVGLGWGVGLSVGVAGTAVKVSDGASTTVGVVTELVRLQASRVMMAKVISQSCFFMDIGTS